MEVAAYRNGELRLEENEHPRWILKPADYLNPYHQDCEALMLHSPLHIPIYFHTAILGNLDLMYHNHGNRFLAVIVRFLP